MDFSDILQLLNTQTVLLIAIGLGSLLAVVGVGRALYLVSIYSVRKS